MTDPALHTLRDRREFLARRPLVLTPSHEQGWFHGSAMLCIDPDDEITCTLAQAATVLDEAFRGSSEQVAVAEISYDGSAIVRTYSCATSLPVNGAWRTLFDADHVPEVMPGALVRDPVFGSDGNSHRADVESIQGAIRRGEVYVANLTYRITGEPTCDPVQAFVTLMARAGAGMGAFLGGPQHSLASVSPERFLSVRRSADGMRQARVQPIKGTRPRGATPVADETWAWELLASEKERAEHVMIVDMERNDLGRVSVPGSVRVDPLYGIVPTPYCHQMESTVHSILRPDVSLVGVLESVFPCGSVTGAPKRAAMGLISVLEEDSRGSYTGALVVARSGQLDSSVLIRTLEFDGDRATWGTGGGITIDSDPSREWGETLLKASPILGFDSV